MSRTTLHQQIHRFFFWILRKISALFRKSKALEKYPNQFVPPKREPKLPYNSTDRLEVREALLKQYNVFQNGSLTHNFSRPYFKILGEKIEQENCGIRALFARRMADYALSLSDKSQFTEKEKSFFYEQLPFILEVVISIQYYHNQIFDSKGGVTFGHPARIKANLIDGNLLERELFNYVDDQVDKRWKSKTAKMLRRTFQLVDIGQKIEQDYNLFKHFQQGQFTQHAFEKRAVELGFIDPERIEELTWLTIDCYEIPHKHAPFLYRYFERINLINSPLFINAVDLIFQGLGITGHIAEHAKRFADYFGMMMQLVNDVVDCSLVENSKSTPGKTEEDTFSDLHNRNLTFPLLLHYLMNPDGQIADYLLGNADFNEENKDKYYHEMIQSHSLYKAIDQGRMIRNKAMLYISSASNCYTYFKDICSIADRNQYYTALYRERAYKKFRRIKRKLRNSRKNKCHEWQQQQ